VSSVIPGVRPAWASDELYPMFDEEEVTQPGFIDYFAGACRTASPYMEFLTQAVGLPY